MEPQAKYWWALSNWKGVGPKTGRKIIEVFGSSMESLFEKSADEKLAEIDGVSMQMLEQDRKELLKQAEVQMAKAQKYKVDLLYRTHEAFPYRMAVFDHLPFSFFYKGSSDLNHPRTVGIIGTRSPSPEGKIIAEQIVRDLVPYQPIIISGLAYGIDITAHKAALDVGLPTVAVLGSGMDKIYPSSHSDVARKMLRNGGVISQFAFGTKPDRENFPMRNQLIAALSDVVIVVESRKEGGSMITAEFANQMNKDVFAVPSRPGVKEAEGCNLLIKSHQAHLMDSVKDIAYVMRWKLEEGQKSIQRQLFVELSEEEQKVYQALQKEKKRNIDQIGYELSLSHSQLSPILLQLEFKGLIKSLPGNQYIAL